MTAKMTAGEIRWERIMRRSVGNITWTWCWTYTDHELVLHCFDARADAEAYALVDDTAGAA